MARNVMSAEDWRTYVPDAFDNRDDPEPVTVEIRPLTAEQARAYQRGLVAPSASRGKKTKRQRLSELEQRAEAVRRRIFSECVRNVRNYSIGEKPVLDGADLYDRGELAFVEDIDAALGNLSKIDEGTLGKSDSPSGSTSPATGTLSNGDAGAAVGETPAPLQSSPTPSAASSATAIPSSGPSHSTGHPSSLAVPGLS